MALLCLINQQRTRAGLRRVRDDRRLTIAAQHHSDDMVARRYFGHISPSGETPQSRIFRSGYTSPHGTYELGENLAWATAADGVDLATPAALVAAWMTSPDHRVEVLTRAFRDTGFGVALGVPSGGRSAGGLTVTEDFGSHG